MKSMWLSCGLVAFLSRCIRGQLLIFPLLSSESVKFDDTSECSCDYNAYNEYDPICGSNGITYKNPTFLHCEQKCKDPNLSVAYKGACRIEASRRPENLTEKYASVHASNTRIMNKCSCAKSNEYEPICGSNGQTYENYADLQCERRCRKIKIGIRNYGLCREEEYFKDPLPFLTDAMKRCGCGYSDEHDPVCGTDGYTYPNPSMLLCVTNCNNPSLQIVHFGECRKDQPAHNIGAVRCDCRSTSKLYRPLCANNGVTYDNFPLFYCAQQCFNRRLIILGEHPCRETLDVDERGAAIKAYGTHY